MKTPEGRLKDQVKKLLDARGVYYFMPVQSGYGKPSLDFLCCYKGFFFAIETKAPGKEPTPRQTLTGNEIHEAGGRSFWSDDIQKLVVQLQPFFNQCDYVLARSSV